MNLFIVASTLLVFISPIVYIRAIFQGRAKPHRTTRLTILATTVLGTASLLAQHDQVAVWLAGASALQALVIFSLSLKFGMGGWAKSDLLCLIIAAIGIVAWQTTTNPIFGLLASIFADLAGMVPTLIKTYRLPKTEIVTFYLLDTVAGLFSLFAVKTWTFQEFGYPLYIFAINFLVALLVLRPKFSKFLLRHNNGSAVRRI